jgi:BlaI family transcriptional regulator, penicillinase repressor
MRKYSHFILTYQKISANFFALSDRGIFVKRKALPLESLSRRERQIMEIIYRLGEVSASNVATELTDAPSYSSVRTLLAILERKGHLTHSEEGNRYIYRAVHRRTDVGQAALKQTLQTFYEGSLEKAVAALLDVADTRLSEEEIQRLGELIERAKRAER